MSSPQARVNIGAAFQRWRKLKTAHGLKSDAAVALSLLDLMKRSPPVRSPSVGASDTKKFSKSEVQTLIRQEVHRAVTQNEEKLKGLMETIQQLESGVICEKAIQRLEARIEMVARRSDAALTHMKELQQQSRPPSAGEAGVLRIHPKKETTIQSKSESSSGGDSGGDSWSGELFEILESTKKSLKTLHEDSRALTAAIADLSQPPPAPAAHSPPQSKCVFVKEEPEHPQYEGDCEGDRDETKSEKLKAGHRIPADPEQDGLLYPPLPPTTFPSTLNSEAASYKIPQKPEVRLALIRNPTRLSVLWNVEKKDPFVAEMDSYTIYLTAEKVKGSCVFSNWMLLGEVKAIELPMCVLVNKYKPGRKVCVAVVGKDVFGRYGPYSKVVTAVIPETLG